MGVTLRYCDLCGNKLGPEELESPQTLKVKDKIFCGDCRPKVMAALQKQKAAQAGGAKEGGAATPRAAAGAPKTAASKPGEAKPGGAGKSSAPKRKAPARKKSTRTAAADPAAAPPPRPATPATTQRPAASRVAKSDADAPRGAAGRVAKKKSTRRAVAGAPKGRSAPPPPDLDTFDEGDPQPFNIRRKSNTPMIVGIIVVVLGGLGAAVALIPGNNPATVKDEGNTKKLVDVQAREQEEKQRKEEAARDALAAAKTIAEKHPEHYRVNISNFENVSRYHKGTAAASEAKQEADRLQGEWVERAQAFVQDLQHQVKTVGTAKDFDEAFARSKQVFELCREVPPIVESSESILDYRNVRKDAHLQFLAMQRLQELRLKAFDRLKLGEEDIAMALLEQLPSKYEEDLPTVWAVRDRELDQIKRTGVKAFVEKMEAEAAEFARLEKERLEKERIARETRWKDTIKQIAWQNQLNPHGSLYNWVVDSDARVFGQPPEWQYRSNVLIAQNTYGHDMYRGIFSNNWQDYMLRMEVRIVNGSLRISPRSQYQVAANSLVSQTSPDIELENLGSGWVPVTLMVRGDTVRMFKGDGVDGEVLFDKTYETGLPGSGGFVFLVADGSHVEFRKIQTKLVNEAKRDAGA